MDINSVVAIVSVIAGLVTIMWFIKDMRKQNGILLKSIEEGQRKGFETLAQVLRDVEKTQKEGSETLAQILRDVEESQKEGSETLAKILKDMALILAKVEENTRR